MNPIILIPSRLAATRLPNKPLLMIGSEPMIMHVWRRAVESGAGEVVVACGDQAIFEVIAKAGGKAVMTDPDLPSGSDRIWQALQKIDLQKKYDVIVNVQGDMPALDPEIIKQALAVLHNPEVDIATLAALIRDDSEKLDPSVVKAVVSHESIADSKPTTNDYRLATGRALYFSRATIPSGDGPLYHHIGLYAYRRPALEKFVSLPPSTLEKREKLEQLRALEAGMRIDVAIVDTVPLGVDTLETLEKVRSSSHFLQGLDKEINEHG